MNHKTSLGEAVSGIHRHVSLRYGVEFQSKVALYAKERASCQNEIAFESMPKERLFKKVIAFIEKAYTDPNHLKTLLTSFKELN